MMTYDQVVQLESKVVAGLNVAVDKMAVDAHWARKDMIAGLHDLLRYLHNVRSEMEAGK